MPQNPGWWKRLGRRQAAVNAATVLDQRRREDERVARDCARLGQPPAPRPDQVRRLP